MKHFKFGLESLKELHGVDTRLAAVATRALVLSPVDFGVHDGMRTREEQEALYNEGASKTMNSRHLTGNAIDLVPYINGRYRWEWIPIYHLAQAVKKAAIEQRVDLIWGGVWDKPLTTLKDDLSAEVRAYIKRRKEKDEDDDVFIDGPHFELM